MAEILLPSRPLLHPVLTLRKDPIRRVATGGGKEETDVVVERLAQQRVVLFEQATALLANADNLKAFAGQFFLVAEMFDDSFATSKAPRDLFRGRTGPLTRGPVSDGYLIEANLNELRELARRIQGNQSIAIRCDISRVKTIRVYGALDLLRARTPETLWSDAPDYDRGRAFAIWLAPFSSPAAREDILKRVQTMRGGSILPTSTRIQLRQPNEIAVADLTERQDSIAILQRDFRSHGHARAVIQIPTLAALNRLLGSGSVFRIEPVRSIVITSPGEGEEPGVVPASIGGQPIVGLVDGGCTARRYESAAAWRESPFIATAHADTKHGNQVASVVVHGHEWNNNLPLPELYCRIGIAQAIPRSTARVTHNPAQLISYLDGVISRHPDTRVWNLSWNERVEVDPTIVSFIGHELSILARKHSVLFVVSAGNKSSTLGTHVAPPADCEAALVVGGRTFNESGKMAGACSESLVGFGPEFQLVPQVSSYSPLRILGGVISNGTSFPTGLLSALAAHTFDNLRDPTPDLVRALITDRTDRDSYEPALGWGTPHAEHMPWTCAPGTVTLAIRAQLQAGIRYYWEDIPIPRELLNGDRIFGHVALTTVHRPLCNEEGGPGYIATRVGAAVQYPNRSGKFTRLVGSKEMEDTAEVKARSEEFKWQPLRRDCRSFVKYGGLGIGGRSLRLYARLYARDIEQFGYHGNADIPPLETVFVVTLSDGSNSSGLYNSMAASLGNFVESAVVDQDIEVDQVDQ